MKGTLVNHRLPISIIRSLVSGDQKLYTLSEIKSQNQKLLVQVDQVDAAKLNNGF